MASGAYSRGVLKILDGTIDLDTTALKVMLLTTSYTYDPDHDQVSDLTAGGGEPSVSGYTGGFNGAGRKAASITLTEQTSSNRVVTIIADLTWTALATGATLRAGALIREITDDNASIPIAYLQFSADVPTNGGDITLDFDGTNGNIRWTV